tara:strand:- start:430 stop:627 length:198 start_codon:yes stop_codon:yes gene_type:complete
MESINAKKECLNTFHMIVSGYCQYPRLPREIIHYISSLIYPSNDEIKDKEKYLMIGSHGEEGFDE